MARRKSSHPFAGESEPNIDISPLIDVAFLLLIYFLVTASLLKQEADLGLALPGVTNLTNDPVEVDQMVIKIGSNSAVKVNDEIVEADDKILELQTFLMLAQRSLGKLYGFVDAIRMKSEHLRSLAGFKRQEMRDA